LRSARSAKTTSINAAAASKMIDQQTHNEQLFCPNFLEPNRKEMCHEKKEELKKNLADRRDQVGLLLFSTRFSA
jgi:hypothetical protein